MPQLPDLGALSLAKTTRRAAPTGAPKSSRFQRSSSNLLKRIIFEQPDPLVQVLFNNLGGDPNSACDLASAIAAALSEEFDEEFRRADGTMGKRSELFWDHALAAVYGRFGMSQSVITTNFKPAAERLNGEPESRIVFEDLCMLTDNYLKSGPQTNFKNVPAYHFRIGTLVLAMFGEHPNADSIADTLRWLKERGFTRAWKPERILSGGCAYGRKWRARSELLDDGGFAVAVFLRMEDKTDALPLFDSFFPNPFAAHLPLLRLFSKYKWNYVFLSDYVCDGISDEFSANHSLTARGRLMMADRECVLNLLTTLGSYVFTALPDDSEFWYDEGVVNYTLTRLHYDHSHGEEQVELRQPELGIDRFASKLVTKTPLRFANANDGTKEIIMLLVMRSFDVRPYSKQTYPSWLPSVKAKDVNFWKTVFKSFIGDYFFQRLDFFIKNSYNT